MAVVRTATVTGHRTTGSSTTLGDTATCNTATTGTDHVAVVLVAISVSTNSSGTTCTVTYGGNAMTQQNLTLVGSSTNRNGIGIYTLVNPPTGSQNVIATTAGASTKAAVAQGGGVYSGVGTISTVTAAASLTVAVPSTVNGKVIAGTTNANSLSAPTQNQLYLDGSAVGGSGDYILVQDANGTGSNVSFSSTGTAAQANSIGIALTPPNPKFNTLVDPFNSAGSPWTATGTVPSNVTFVGGQLKILHGAGVELNEYETTPNKFDLIANSVSVELADAGNQSLADHEAWFYVQLDDTNRLLFIVADNLLKFYVGASSVSADIAYSASTHRFLRFREAGGTTFYDTSDGSTWTNRVSFANLFAMTDMIASVLAVQWVAGSASYVTWDNFNIMPGAAAPVKSYRNSRVAMQRANLW